MKPLRVAAVRNNSVAVVVVLVEPEQHAVDPRQNRERRFVHVLRGLGLENLLRVITPVLQVGDHEMRHVRTGQCQAAGGRGTHNLNGLGR